MANRPRWKVPEYTKKEINDAGLIMRDPLATASAIVEARAVIDNWRAAHAYPLHVFYMNLRRRASSRPDIIVVERLKRLESIVDKLQREPSMELYRMQDLGGCRVVVPTIEEVYSFSSRFQNSDIRHEAKTPKDYIQNPKTSGYRSLHLIYRFRTDTQEKDIYNQYPMLIELQFRTHLQHIWATAVESLGLFMDQALKSGRGDESVKRFFVLVSSLFAMKENCPLVPGTPDNEDEIISELKAIDNEHHVIDKLRAVRVAVDSEADNISGNKGYYILRLDYAKHILSKIYFKPSEIEKASKTYEYLESQYSDSSYNIVLVRATSFATVKEAYPNYFLDIGEFVRMLYEFLD